MCSEWADNWLKLPSRRLGAFKKGLSHIVVRGVLTRYSEWAENWLKPSRRLGAFEKGVSDCVVNTDVYFNSIQFNSIQYFFIAILDTCIGKKMEFSFGRNYIN
jgi:hypothetical protein